MMKIKEAMVSMLREKDEVILPTSPKAARYTENLSGWVSRNGRFYGEDEQFARIDGATAVGCASCGSAIYKGYTLCTRCSDENLAENYHKRKGRRWDGETPLYSARYDKYFFYWEEVEEFCKDCDEGEELTIEQLLLVICEPVELPNIDEDFFFHELPDDMETPQGLLDAITAFNKAVKENTPELWEEGRCRAIIPEDGK